MLYTAVNWCPKAEAINLPEGQSKSTLHNYSRCITLFVIHFGKLPEQIYPEEINEFLPGLARGQHNLEYARHKSLQGGQYHRNITETDHCTLVPDYPV